MNDEEPTMSVGAALEWVEDATPGEDIEGWIAKVLAAEVRRLQVIEQRARNVHEFIAFPRAEQGEQQLAEFAEDVARIILGEAP